MEKLILINIEQKFQDGTQEKVVLDNLNLTIEENEFVAIIGKSGSGKTTLLNIIGGLEKPTKGSVIISNVDVTQLKDEECAKFRRNNIGFIFQNYNLIPILNVEENIKMLPEIDRKKIDKEFFLEIIRALGLEKLLRDMPNTLSGGEQQRVAIARAMLSKPEIIIADEPTGNLDEDTAQDVLNLLKEVRNRFRQTIIIVTHDLSVAKLADRQLRLSKGRLHETEYL